MMLWAGCVLGWAVWMWPQSPGLALAGAALLSMAHSVFLGLEFLMLGRAASKDVAPRPTGGQQLRAWARETVMDLVVFGWLQPFRWRQLPDCLDGPSVKARRGMVFVHGFWCNRAVWQPWLRRMQSEGRAFVAVNLEPPFGEIDDYAPVIERAVQDVRRATGLPPLLVCHSMGGLAARAWWRTRSFDDSVAQLVTIGTPHTGTWVAHFSRLPNGRQMRRDSGWLADLNQQQPPEAAGRITCWWSNCDNVVMPPSTATLRGADNRLVPGVAHLELAWSAEVMDGSFALLARWDCLGLPPT